MQHLESIVKQGMPLHSAACTKIFFVSIHLLWKIRKCRKEENKSTSNPIILELINFHRNIFLCYKISGGFYK